MVAEHGDKTMPLKRRATIVTATVEGIGREYAKVLAARGVAVADINLNRVLLFLLSDAAALMTAQTLIVDGGYLKRL